MNGYIKKIEQINFGLMSPDDIREMSVVTVETPDTYEDDGFPIEKGLMDPRLGVIDPSLVCRTCGFRGGDCQGHFGSIELARPVIHIGFGDVIHKILRSTCNSCGRVLLPENVLEEYTKKITEAMENKESISEILKKLQNETKKVEMSDAKQNDIVDKIMKEVYPEGEDNYDDADSEDLLLNILDQLYAEAYMERDETEGKPHFKYIDPKQLCPHCKKNQSMADIEASYDMIEAKNADDLHKLHDKIVEDVEEEFEKKVAKIDKKIEKLQESDEVDKDAIVELEEEKTDILAEAEEKSEDKVQKEFKRRLRDFVKQYLQELIQEPILLDKPVTIRRGDYKLTASEVRERLENITDYDSFVLGVNPEVARPEWLVLTVLPVPPVTVRPSITLDTGERSEDDLTHKLVDILRINQRLLENMEAGAPQLIVEDLWELLQYHVTTYFDNEASGVPPARHRSGRPLKTLTQRLKGKEGRFRSNLSGKRVNFSARTVISPDPNISINEVGVPEMIAKEVTVPVYVNEWNIEEMKEYIKNGPEQHPGANYVIRTDGRKIRVRGDETKELILEQLEPGFIIERHLKDGDMVLFNRQPSLHRMSMMAHEVRVLPYKTFRLNLCVCPPYNADFDGDEMNMHVFQTDESRAEAKSLMRVQEHILSPRFGGPIIGAIHDHISGAYLLTREGVEFTEEQALQIIRKSHLKLPELKSGQWILKQDPEFSEDSYIFKEKGEMWTGKELFSLLLPNDLNLSYSAEISKCPVVYPEEDATVVIKNGILVQGVIDESAYGSFSGKILDKIVKEYGPGRAKEFLDRSTDLAICGIMKTGITTSLNDEEIPEEAQDRINEHLDKKMAEVDKLVESYEEGYLQALPGRSLEETLEMKIMQVLGEARDMSGSIAENYLTMGKQYPEDPYDHVMAVENHSVVMARTGARASMLNLTQITACVGQQAVRGGRIERGYLNRTLPHFKKGELGAKAKGFVHSSYKSGLDPIEFFFHAMGGREGLVDTAIRTAQSGYMQRRLVNALQDLSVDFDGAVKDNHGMVIQTMFGEDGVDPAKSDFGKAANLDKLISEIRMESGMEGNSNIYSVSSNKNVKKIEDVNQDVKRELLNLMNLYEMFIIELNKKIDNLDVILVDEIKPILEDVTSNYYELSNNNSLKLNDYENSLKIVKKYTKLLYESKKKYSNKIKNSNENIAFLKWARKISERKKLYNNFKQDVNELNETYLVNKESLEDIANDVNQLSGVLSDKKNIINEIEIISNEISNNLKIISDLENNINLVESNNIKEIEDSIRNINEVYDIFKNTNWPNFESRINKLRNLVNNYINNKTKVKYSDEVENLISEFDKCLNNPFLSHDLRRFELTNEEIQSMKNNIKNDIIEQKIKGKNLDFKLILISYCKEYTKTKNELSDGELDEILSKFDLSHVDKSIIDECKSKVKKDYEENKITKNQIPIKFNKLLDKKFDEIKKLKELDEIKNNPNSHNLKQYLSQDDCISIYIVTEEKICSEYGLRESVFNFVQQEMYRKNEKNKSEAREEFKSFRYNMKYFLELTELQNYQVESFIRNVELLIGDNKIRKDDFNEEFIVKLSLSYKINGRIEL